MWCGHCQREVPAARDASSELRCRACGHMFAMDLSDAGSSSVSDEGIPLERLEVATVSMHPPIDLNDWEVVERLKYIERHVAPKNNASVTKKNLLHRLDPAVVEPSYSRSGKQSRKKETPTHSGGRVWFIWLLAIAGSVLWMAGIATSSQFTVLQPWLDMRFGVPLQFAGVCILLFCSIAGILQTNALSRRITNQLKNLKTTTDDLRVAVGTRTNTINISSYYRDASSGASPNLLLADLQGQLDQLSEKMDRNVGR